jgi:hypothetical protein
MPVVSEEFETYDHPNVHLAIEECALARPM